MSTFVAGTPLNHVVPAKAGPKITELGFARCCLNLETEAVGPRFHGDDG